MSEKFDVAIVGGGPAGTGLAIALTRTGRKVAVLERSHYDYVRIGETLPPSARLPLINLGVWDRFINQGHAVSPAILSAWGQDELYENHFIFNPYGNGWHIDRRRFDEMLALVAEEAGTVVCRGARVTTCLPHASREWLVKFNSEGKRGDLQAGFLVDATGRASVLSRRQGAKRIFYDRLVSIIGFFSSGSAEQEADQQTLVEAVEEGWWYSAWLPNSLLIVAYMTDADLLAKGRVSVRGDWLKRLDKAPHTRLRVSGHVLETSLRTVAANSYRTTRVTGQNWLAAGDAAAAYDPLSSRGIYNALKSGLQATWAIEGCWRGDQTALNGYELWTQKSYDEYLRMRIMYYDREQRWPYSAFWQRRQKQPDRSV